MNPRPIDLSDIRVGDSYALFYNEGNRNNRTFHVRAVVDERWFALRTWSGERRRWDYSIEPIEFFEVAAEMDRLELIARNDKGEG